jgi:hypothetical protein
MEDTAEDVPEFENPVIVGTFRDLPEALLAKGSLESAGIKCALLDDNTIRMDWFWSNLLGGIKLFVDARDVEDATDILSQPIPESLGADEDQNYPQPACPKCESLDVSFEELYKPIAFGSLFINLPLPVQRTGWICQSCRHTWHEEESSQSEGST